MSFRKDSKKWKKTNKNLNKHKKQKQKGGEYNPTITGNFSTNDFFNYYLEKYSESILAKDGTQNVKEALFQPFDANQIKTEEQNILYVIDMQNDFIDDVVTLDNHNYESPPDPTDDQRFVINGIKIDLYRKLGGPGGTGNFSVTEGNAVVKKIIDFIENNHEKFDKIIFTRDWHPRDHCSFNDKPVVEGQPTNNTGHYPPHCIFNTLGACFAPTIKEKITYEKNGFVFKINEKRIPIDIIFKGFHQDTDSYTAEKWPENEKYPIKPRQLSSCCPNGNCKKENTGGYKLKDGLYKWSNNMIIYDKGKEEPKSSFNDDMDFDKTPLFQVADNTNFYVVGLAGDFCVKDTAINLRNNYPDSKVYVIQELTRYVFLPAFIGLERLKLTNPENSNPCVFEEKLLPYGEWLIDDGKRLSDDVFKNVDATSEISSESPIHKALSSYMFRYNPVNNKEIQRLNKTDLLKYKETEVTDKLGLWHFSTDHRTLVKDYFNNEVKILKSKSEDQEEGQGQLLMISDIEGCAAKNASGTEQSQVMCSQPFFKAIEEFLEKNTNNKVAFLGDYFDQGPHVITVINNIIKLYDDEKYAGRVHIILGNRDINKLRLHYELQPEFYNNQKIEKGWEKVWGDFYKDVREKPRIGDKEKLEFILKKSMGVKVNQLYLKDGLKPEESLNILLNIFIKADDNITEEEDKLFIKNFKKLYEYGKIVVYDEYFKTLLSHAGGMDQYIFHDETYYSNIIKSMSEVDSSKLMPAYDITVNYFDMIEKCRTGLMKKPNETSDININKIVNIINSPLEKALNLSEDQIKIKDDKWFCLLQALGLKPDDPTKESPEPKHFISFVQSCDVASCTGPRIGPDNQEYKNFISELSKLGVKAVGAGHAPHCLNAPIIYKRTGTDDNENVIIIANDTSNGGRPATIKEVSDVPVSYITKIQDKPFFRYSVGSLSKDGNLSIYKIKDNANKILNYDNENNDYTDLIGDWTVDTAYTVKQNDGHMSIVNNKTTILNFTKEGFTRAVTEKQITKGGGKKRKGRVTKKKRKYKKNNKHTSCNHHH